jgi:hypothetical protein
MLSDFLVQNKQVRLLEKTPKNSLRISFLREVFPDARFVFLYREPRGNIASLIDGWNAEARFESYKLPHMTWKFLLPPRWEALQNVPVPAIAAAQWRIANEAIMDGLRDVDIGRWHFVDYDQLIDDTITQVVRLCEFACINAEDVLEGAIVGGFPLSKSALSPPRRDKWKRHQKAVNEILPSLNDIMERIQQFREST